ncbi:MAG: UbiH/UbiF family hydroxylase, partial [Alphaproteobacteria bacterium]
RRREVALRMSGIDLLNRAAQAEAQPLRDLRRIGLGTLYRLPPLRRLAMRAGMNLR